MAAHPGLGGQGMGFSSLRRGAREDHEEAVRVCRENPLNEAPGGQIRPGEW